MTFLLLHEARLQRIGAYALIAVAFMGALNAAFGSSPLGVVRLAALTWVPAAGLALLLRRRRSLTLTVQFSVLALLVATLLFFVVQGESNAFGQTLVGQVADVLRESGYEQQAEVLIARQDVAAWQLIGLILLLLWSSFAAWRLPPAPRSIEASTRRPPRLAISAISTWEGCSRA